MISEVKTFDDSEFRNNGFGLIRYIVASLIILSHFFWQISEVSGVSVPVLSSIFDPVKYYNRVVGLLTISGYLVAASVEKTKSLKEFFVKRILRLYPEYWMCAIVTLVSLLIIVPQLVDKSILFWLGTQIFGIPNTPVILRTYGTGVINGPLWTVFVQIQLYFVLGFFHKHVKKLKTWQWLILLAFLLGANIGSSYLVSHVGEFTTKVIGKLFIPYAIWFFIGAFIYYKRDRMIPLLKKAFFPLIIAYVLAKLFGIHTPGYFEESLIGVLGSLFIIGGGYLLPKMHFRVDLTYGMFLYHWPIINIIIHYNLLDKLHWGLCLLILVAATMVMAFLSYKFVGQPSKKIIKNLSIEKKAA